MFLTGFKWLQKCLFFLSYRKLKWMSHLLKVLSYRLFTTDLYNINRCYAEVHHFRLIVRYLLTRYMFK